MSVDKAIRSFEDLEVFQRAYRVSLDIHRASLEFPKIEQYALADQVRRASKAICANLAEGLPSSGDRRPSTGGSCRWQSARPTKCASGGATVSISATSTSRHGWVRWRDEYQQIARMLTGLHAAWHRSGQE